MARRMKVNEPTTTTPDEQSASGEREKEIARLQDEAVARTRAAAAPSPPMPMPTPSNPGPRAREAMAAAQAEDVGEVVSATWGEELYTPQQFFTYRVGPFSRQTKIREGESALMAKRRISAELAEMAADERKTKMTIFLDTMAELFTESKKRSGK